jgi:hypothetical protein
VTDILKQLQRPAWREIEFPITGREYGFQQSQAKHRYVFRDNELIESLGRDNPTWRYTIPFREDITVGGWEHLFIGVYPDFLAACQDRSRGVLTDPFHGSKPAKCVSLREIMDVNKRDGLDVEAEFIHAPAETDFENDLGTVIRTLQGYASYARRFDNELATIPWQQELPPEPVMNPLDAISAVGGQALLVQGKVTAALADSAFRLEKSVATIDALRNPDLAPTRTQARRLQAAALDIEDRVDVTGAKPLRKITTSTNIAVAALAGKLGVPLELLLKWNPFLRKSPLVKINTEIRVSAETLSKPNGRTARA